jgi:GNAT superfamily N-acetyltransferase
MLSESNNVICRKVQSDDFEFMFKAYLDVHLLENEGKEYTAQQQAERTSMIRGKADLGNGLIMIEVGETRIGFVSFELVTEYPFGFNYGDFGKGLYMWVSLVYVEESHRGSGIGKKLYAEVDQFARSHDIKDIYLDVYANNSKSIEFHHSMGFEPEVTIFRKRLS